MYKIIKPRGTGKTTDIIKLAHENDAIIVCAVPRYVQQLAEALGYEHIQVIDYATYILFANNYQKSFVIDEIDGLLNKLKVIGYSLSEED